MKRDPLRLAVVGPGRSGKDTACEWLRDNTKLRFNGGCSWTGRLYVAERLGISPEEAWETRHQRRMEWYTLLNEYRKEEPHRLVQDVLKHSDIVCGVRDGSEMKSAIEHGLFDLVVWIDRDVPPDPTLTFGIETADVIIPNHWSVGDFHQRLRRFSEALGILRC